MEYWGKAKSSYYFTDYVDKDYPSKLSAKEEQLASLEEAEALRIQKRLASTLDNLADNQVFDLGEDVQADLLDLIAKQNSSTRNEEDKTREDLEAEDLDDEDLEDEDLEEEEENTNQGRERRPINMAIQKNRGLTPYKKKGYRNPRVKHKLKYKKAMGKRRRLVKEAKVEYKRYSGEAAGIKTSTIRSINLFSTT